MELTVTNCMKPSKPGINIAATNSSSYINSSTMIYMRSMQVEDYTHLLNSSECRRGRTLIEVFLALSRDGHRQYPSFCLFHWILNYLHHLKLSQAHNLVYWFKNTRAALRRSQLRETAATRLVFQQQKKKMQNWRQ